MLSQKYGDKCIKGVSRENVNFKNKKKGNYVHM